MTVAFGIILDRPEVEPVPVLPASFSIIGMISTSADANNAVLPLMTPVRWNSQDATLKAGMGTGHIAAAVNLINANLGDLSYGSDLVIIRVAVGSSEAETIQNCIDALDVMRNVPASINVTPRLLMIPGYTHQTESSGGQITVTPAESREGGNHGDGVCNLTGQGWLAGIQAGVYKVRVSGGTKAVTSATKVGGNVGDGTVGSLTVDTTSPLGAWRLVCGIAAPGASVWSVLRPDGTLDGLANEAQAYNSTSGPNFTISAKTLTDYSVADEFVLTVVDAVPAGGGVITVQRPDSTYLANGTVGVAYATEVAFTMTAGAEDYEIGDGFNLTVQITNPTQLANPVIAALPSVLGNMLATAYVNGPWSSRLATQNWRETINSDRIMPIGMDVKVFEDAAIVDRPSAPAVVGLINRIDHTVGGQLPFDPFANRPLYGIVGVSRPMSWSIYDESTEGQILLNSQISVICPGELGVDSAIDEGGYIFVGTESASTNQLWSQIHEVRATDYVTVLIGQITKKYLGRKVTADTVEAWLDAIAYMLLGLRRDNRILGYKVEFKKDANTPENVRLGRLKVSIHFEPAPAFRVATHELLRWRPAIDALVTEIVTRMNNNPASQYP